MPTVLSLPVGFVFACVHRVFGHVWGMGWLAKLIGMKVHGVKHVGPGLRPQLWNRSGADRFVIACVCCAFASAPCAFGHVCGKGDWPNRLA